MQPPFIHRKLEYDIKGFVKLEPRLDADTLYAERASTGLKEKFSTPARTITRMQAAGYERTPNLLEMGKE